jgi:hypothetical protein
MLGSNAVGVDPATGRQILRAPDGSTRLGARPLLAYSPQEFTSALANDPLKAYWMLANGGSPAHDALRQATGWDQNTVNNFINQHAPGIGQVWGGVNRGWIPTQGLMG